MNGALGWSVEMKVVVITCPNNFRKNIYFVQKEKSPAAFTVLRHEGLNYRIG